MSAKFSCAAACDVHIFRVLEDNYSYLFAVDDKCWLVDPVTPEPLLEHAAALKLRVCGAFVTHKHWDHAGGNARFLQLVPDAQIYGSREVPHITQEISSEADVVELGGSGGMAVRPLMTPCHTQQHVCFVLTEHGEPRVVFTGDTLFVGGGCGRFFEGTAEDMFESLKKLKSLPPETQICCGHEYAIANAQFAAACDPSNSRVQEYLVEREQAKARSHDGDGAFGDGSDFLLSPASPFSVPQRLAVELAISPFLRCEEAQMRCLTRTDVPVEVLQRLRTLKDKFSPRSSPAPLSWGAGGD